MTTVQVQRQLLLLGYYNGNLDGIFGQQTLEAIKAFQADNGLTVDGKFGAKSQAKSKEIIIAIQKAIGANVDGLAGSETFTKVKAYQKKHGLTVDGVAGVKTRAKIFGNATDTKKTQPNKENATENTTDDWWNGIKYFKRSEFKCHCGGKYCNGFPVEPAKELVELLDTVRAHYGKPFTPSSAIRCKKHNANVGGASGSQHLYGTAADIPASSLGVTPEVLYNYLCSLLPNSGGVGLYSWGCHVDTRKAKSRWNG